MNQAVYSSENVGAADRSVPFEGARIAGSIDLSELSDADLLAGTRRLVGRSNQLLASLLAHLAELEARGIHRTRACASLYTYCIYELRLSEDEAYRRVTAARLVRRFPALLGPIAAGELHLTGLLMLGPHFTDGNLVEVIERAKHRTKKEIARLVRVLAPLPDVPSRIEPLGPLPSRAIPVAPTWSAFVQSTCPVRELAPGERPGDWVELDPKGTDETERALTEVVPANEIEGGLELALEGLPLSDSERRPPAPARLAG